ncbi:MAG: LytTR family DNA-binding domain-containing protein [bacterium]
MWTPQPSDRTSVRTVVVADVRGSTREAIDAYAAENESIHVVVRCASGFQGLCAIRAHKPDLVFADVELSDMSGLQMMQRLAQESASHMVFVSRTPSAAAQASALGAQAHLLHPFGRTSIDAAVTRVRQAREHARREVALPRQLPLKVMREADNEGPLTSVTIRGRTSDVVVAVDQIDWIEGADYYTGIHVGTKVHLLRQTMASLEQRLDPRHFYRVHRSAIVNLRRVAEVTQTQKGDPSVVLVTGKRLKVTRARRDHLERLLPQAGR